MAVVMLAAVLSSAQTRPRWLQARALWSVFGAGAAFHLHGGGQSIMNSGWFIEGLVSQTLVVHMLRTRRIPFIQSTASLPVLLSTSVAIFVGAGCRFLHWPRHWALIRWITATGSGSSQQCSAT
jgi:hypothetical protein